MNFIFSISCVYFAMSGICYVLYAKDKKAAVRQLPRTPEKTLWLVGLLCGWPGALIAQRQFRHKTAKPLFQIVFWITVAINMAVLLSACWRYFQ
jgi:uncharacterized membrane protein YsdA (DUF1294 family)